MTKHRILVVENSIDFTGALNSIIRSCTELKDSFDFTFVLPKGSKLIETIRSLGFSVHVLSMREIRKNWLALLMYLPALMINSVRFARLVKELESEIVLSNDFYNLIPPFYKILGGRVPYICYVRFRPSKFPAFLVKFWCWFHYRYAAVVVAVSNVVQRELPVSSKLIVIGNEVPSGQLAFSVSTSHTILYPANYMQGKGHEFALRAFAAINARHPHWKLKFIGSDMGLEKNRRYKSELQKETERLELSEVVEWGHFETNISKQYLEAAIVLNFSESESFSLTCLEAMYHGCPVISTRCGGPEEFIDDGHSGLLVNLTNVGEMATAIETLINNPAMREELGRVAFRSVREKYRYENTVGRLKEVYYSLLPPQSFNTR